MLLVKLNNCSGGKFRINQISRSGGERLDQQRERRCDVVLEMDDDYNAHQLCQRLGGKITRQCAQCRDKRL